MKRTILVVVALVAFAGPAMADLSMAALDDPTGGGSWWQAFLITDGTFDRVTIGAVTGFPTTLVCGQCGSQSGRRFDHCIRQWLEPG